MAVGLACGGARVAHGVFSWERYFPAMGSGRQEVDLVWDQDLGRRLAGSEVSRRLAVRKATIKTSPRRRGDAEVITGEHPASPGE